MADLVPFGVEAWLNQWEKRAQYDLAQSTIAALSTAQVFKLTGVTGQHFLLTWRQRR